MSGGLRRQVKGFIYGCRHDGGRLVRTSGHHGSDRPVHGVHFDADIEEAEKVVTGKRETSRQTRDQDKRRATPKSSPTLKVFRYLRATLVLHLSDAIVKAWKESVGFATGADKIIDDAIAWLNMDKYIMSVDGVKGIVKAICAMLLVLNCDTTFIVHREVGYPGYVRALLGHCSFVSTKVRLRRLERHCDGWRERWKRGCRTGGSPAHTWCVVVCFGVGRAVPFHAHLLTVLPWLDAFTAWHESTPFWGARP